MSRAVRLSGEGVQRADRKESCWKPVGQLGCEAPKLLDGWMWTAQDKTLEKTLNEEPIQRVRVVAAQSLGLARRRGIQIPVRHVAAACCRPSRPI